MNIYINSKRYKIGIIVFAVFISLLSLGYSNYLIDKLQNQERQRVELYAEAMKRFAQTSNLNEDLTFVSEVISRNENIPVILTDENDSIISFKNLNQERVHNPKYLVKQLLKMKAKHQPVVIDLLDGKIERHVYYDDSTLLNLLFWFPLVQLGVFGVFIAMAYMAFSSSRRAEQNRVWVGMAKETAHQLGTPISSLLAWVELMKVEEMWPEYTDEMSKDLERLEIIVERFSKVGALPILKPTDVNIVLADAVSYMQRRTSSQIVINFYPDAANPIIAPLNRALFTWVIENVLKNAIDAIGSKGEINVAVSMEKSFIHVDVTDNGKGIVRGRYKTVFRPGITTKQRGWGLGLSLAKRIIKEYHKGNIFIKWSEPGKGTTLRISLKAK